MKFAAAQINLIRREPVPRADVMARRPVEKSVPPPPD